MYVGVAVEIKEDYHAEAWRGDRGSGIRDRGSGEEVHAEAQRRGGYEGAAIMCD